MFTADERQFAMKQMSGLFAETSIKRMLAGHTKANARYKHKAIDRCILKRGAAEEL